MEDFHLVEMWFQQDIATCHMACEVRNIFRGKFWTAKLMQFIFTRLFVVGYMKLHVAGDKLAIMATAYKIYLKHTSFLIKWVGFNFENFLFLPIFKKPQYIYICIHR